MKVKVPIIFISNYSPYSDRAFVHRLAMIEAIENLENVEKVKFPKEEVDAQEEIEVAEILTSDDNEEMDGEIEYEKENAPRFPEIPPKKKAVLEKRILGENSSQ
jgi:hypothetical protein